MLGLPVPVLLVLPIVFNNRTVNVNQCLQHEKCEKTPFAGTCLSTSEKVAFVFKRTTLSAHPTTNAMSQVVWGHNI